jgi:MFS family permease
MSGGHPRGQRLPQARAVSSGVAEETGAIAVLRNRPFLLLWLSQAATQIGGNMILFGLTVMVGTEYDSVTAVSALLLSFLVPAVLFGAMAGVFVDRVDKRALLVVTNLLRAVAFVVVFFIGNNLLLLYPLVILVATLNTFFAPAEAAMIPSLVPRNQLLAANGLFTLTLNVAFAIGFALFGPFVIAVASPQVLILLVAAFYFVAVVFCWVLPASPPVPNGATAGQAVADAERAVETMFSQFVDGVTYIRQHHNVGWSLSYLGIAGALVGILGALGTSFARVALGLGPKDFVVIVLPLGLGVVTGILALNRYGRLMPRRRAIELGMIGLGVLLVLLAIAGPAARFLEGRAAANGLQDVAHIISLLSVVAALAYLIGIAYAVVAISAQTQLQEDLPEEVRGRVFGVLNMLVSVGSLLPIVVVGPIADVVGTSTVIFVTALLVWAWGVTSLVRRGRLRPAEIIARAGSTPSGAPVDPLTAATSPADLPAMEARAEKAYEAEHPLSTESDVAAAVRNPAAKRGQAGRPRSDGPGAAAAQPSAPCDDGEALA